MKKRVLLTMIGLCFCLLLSLSSCKTPETQVEYVPVELDIQDLIQPMLKMRPDDVKLIDPPETLSDIMSNSVSFQYAYETWKGYAEALENFYLSIGKV